MSESSKSSLSAYLTPLAVLALSFGYAVGWGSFVMPGNGHKALEALEASVGRPFDIVLTDMWMPEMDGEGLVKAIRAREKLKSLPVYVVTADVEMQKRFRDVGFTGILLKPVTVATIGPVLADTAERRS